MKKIFSCFIATVLISICMLNLKTVFGEEKKLDKGLYATFKTSIGDFVCKLYEDEAPITVENFVGLATGTKEHLNPNTKEMEKKNFYDGLIFHRVIPDFMIQGGCPLGSGIGNPGYKFKDEFSPNLKHDRPGILSMANSGPNTNGSQFFITVAPTPWLDNRHSIFGAVVEGMDIVNKIVNVKRDGRDKPLEDIVIEKLEISKIE